MKVLKGILSVAALLCVVGITLLTIAESDKISTVFVLGVNGAIIAECLLLLALLFLGTICVATIIQRIRSGEGKKLLLIIGSLIFLVPVIFMVKPIAKDLKSYRRLEEMKSPDGQHTLYTREAKTVNGCDVTVCYRRTGAFTYEELFKFDEYTEDLIRWSDNGVVYVYDEYEYSSYEK